MYFLMNIVKLYTGADYILTGNLLKIIGIVIGVRIILQVIVDFMKVKAIVEMVSCEWDFVK